MSEWDSSESESVPVVRSSHLGPADAASSAAATDKPALASVTEKPEVRCIRLAPHWLL